ncbi:hypothetical protein SDC9_102350 [bioreactor metagenome]|uniref:Uncharacterized protein n=1 Tax=bioreactor metagenome TaxID=1076179 RepID=A0A645AXB6_9ZZZZ
MHDQPAPEILRDGLLGQVIICRPQPTGGDDDVGAFLRNFKTVFQTVGIITHDGLVVYVDPDRGQFLRDELRIGIDDISEQQFGSYSDDFSIHTLHLLRFLSFPVLFYPGHFE